MIGHAGIIFSCFIDTHIFTFNGSPYFSICDLYYSLIHDFLYFRRGREHEASLPTESAAEESPKRAR